MRDVRWAGAGRWPATCAGTARAATALRVTGCEALRCGQLWAGPRGIPRGWRGQGPAWGGTDGGSQRPVPAQGLRLQLAVRWGAAGAGSDQWPLRPAFPLGCEQ